MSGDRSRSGSAESFQTRPFLKVRKAYLQVLEAGRRKNIIHGLVEIDVTEARRQLRQRRVLTPSAGRGVRVVRSARDDVLLQSEGVRTVQVPKPTEADKERFRDLVPNDRNVEIKPMFGNLGAFVNGNMFMGLFGPDIGVKLNQSDEKRVREAGGGSFGPAERPMGGYVSLPGSATPEQLGDWINSALAYVASLPPKQPKARKA